LVKINYQKLIKKLNFLVFIFSFLSLASCNYGVPRFQYLNLNNEGVKNCIIGQLNGSLEGKTLLDISKKMNNNFPNVLELDSVGGNFFFSFELAKKIIERKVPVYIHRDSKCQNDCSIVYLASPIRFSETSISFPRYSQKELQIIKFKNKNVFRSLISEDGVMTLLSLSLKKNELRYIEKSKKDTAKDLSGRLNFNLKPGNRVSVLKQMCKLALLK
jgi:hypothetical protein